MPPGGETFRLSPRFGENVLRHGSHKWLPYSKDEVHLKSSNNIFPYCCNLPIPQEAIIMRLAHVQEHLKLHAIPYRYYEENDCGSITFVHKGLSYHIWEYPAPERGAQSNVRSAGKSEDFDEDYEQQILDILETWWK